MEKLDYYKKRYHAFCHYVIETQGDESRKMMEEEKIMIDQAYDRQDEKFLRAMDRELTVGINDYPKEHRLEMNYYIELELQGKDKLDFYKDRFYAFYNYLMERLDQFRTDSLELVKREVDEAYKQKDEHALREINQGVDEALSGYPLKIHLAIRNRIIKDLGMDKLEAETKRTKKLQTILKRGSIKNRDEYELVHSEVDQLSNSISDGEPIPKNLLELDRILTDYSCAL